jgi:hypothetical protein
MRCPRFLALRGRKWNIFLQDCFARTAPPGPNPQEKRFAAYWEGLAKAPWSDEAVLAAVRAQVLPAMTRRQPIVARIVDDTRILKNAYSGDADQPVRRDADNDSGRWRSRARSEATLKVNPKFPRLLTRIP